MEKEQQKLSNEIRELEKLIQEKKSRLTDLRSKDTKIIRSEFKVEPK